MNHMLKAFLKVIKQRLFRKCERIMGETQFGFKEAMGTREALFSIKTLIQNYKDVRKEVFLCFIDYEKAFDRIKHDRLIGILKESGIDDKDIRCIANLYWNQTAEIEINNMKVDNLQIRRGVRQGCILSPLLFNIYSEEIFQKATEDIEKGVKVNGFYVNNIRFADDTVLIADNMADLQDLLNRVNYFGKQAGLTINHKKTKMMIISRNINFHVNQNLHIDNIIIERVMSFKYLGSWLNESWNCDKEIRCRIEAARTSFQKFKNVLCNNQVNIKSRLRFLKCYVWSILLYCSETWTLKITTTRKLEAFEMWCYRRIMKISWTDKIRNEEVLRRLRKNLELLKTIKHRKTSYFGHIIRGEKYYLLQRVLEGRIEGRRSVGRMQMSWLQNIKHWTNIHNMGELIHTARNRSEFSNILLNLR
jgi:hypothetical protein